MRDWGALLAGSAAEVLETMFFICACEKPETAWVSKPAGALAAHLKFHGRLSGDLTVALAPGSARTLATNFLALSEEEVAQAQVSEVLCELASMICGSVLTQVDSEMVFELSRPELACPESIPSPGEGREEVRRTLDLGDGPLALRFRLRSAA
jgi:CheY-specific phosphatase CheX